jgi:hypothetical protein
MVWQVGKFDEPKEFLPGEFLGDVDADLVFDRGRIGEALRRVERMDPTEVALPTQPPGAAGEA